MAKVNLFRLLNAQEIECRVGSITKNGVSLLLYKDARVDANILDETVGAYNWKKEYSRDNANCTVSLWDSEKGQWISKEDVGVESFSEKEKGLASDSFKRACFAWGLGRELYTAPFIWINAPTEEIKDSSGRGTGKYKLVGYGDWAVQSIAYNDNREISQLTIIDKTTGEVVYPRNGSAPAKKGSSKSAAKSSSTMSMQAAMIHVFETGVMTGHQGSKLITDVKSEEKAKNCLKAYAELDNADGEAARALLDALAKGRIQFTVKAN